MLALELAVVATLILLDGFKIGRMALDSLVTEATASSSTSPTISQAASRAATKFCGGRG